MGGDFCGHLGGRVRVAFLPCQRANSIAAYTFLCKHALLVNKGLRGIKPERKDLDSFETYAATDAVSDDLSGSPSF